MSLAEANGKLRRFRARVTTQANSIHQILSQPTLDKDIDNLIHRSSSRGRTRAAQRLRSFFPTAFGWSSIPEGLLGAYLDAPPKPIIETPADIGQTQNCVLISYLILGTKQQITATGLWTLEVPDHALRRAFERDPNGDVSKKIQEAHTALLHSPATNAPKLDTKFLIPTSGPGAFLAEWIVGEMRYHTTSGLMDTDTRIDKTSIVYARVRTWLHDDQLFESQTQSIIRCAKKGEPTLFEKLLVPVELQLSNRKQTKCLDLESRLL